MSERIWKYKLGDEIPIVSSKDKIVRFDKIDGEWYVWVRVEDDALRRGTLNCHHTEIILPIKEDFIIELPYNPSLYKIVSEDGFMKLKVVRYSKLDNSDISPCKVHIKMLGTGSEIGTDLDDGWLYLGFGHIHIQQELELHVYSKLA